MNINNKKVNNLFIVKGLLLQELTSCQVSASIKVEEILHKIVSLKWERQAKGSNIYSEINIGLILLK